MKKLSHFKLLSILIFLLLAKGILAQSDPNLLLYLPFDGTTADRSSNGRANTPVNVSYVNDHENRTGLAGSFIAAGNRIETTFTHPATQGLSFGFWFKPNVNLTGSSPRTIFAEHLGFYLMDYQAGKLRFFVRNQTPTDIEYSITTNFTANTWYHIVFTINSLTEQAFLYIDNTKNTIQTASTIQGINNTKLTIGAANNGVLEIAAVLDELRIYSKALTDTEVASWYNDAATSDIVISNNSIDEGTYTKQFIGKISSTDSDAGDVIKYSAVSSSNILQLSNDSLFVTGVLDYESVTSYTIRIRAGNQINEGTEKDLVINVTNIDEKPYYKGTFSEYNAITNRTFQFKLSTVDFTDPEGTPIGNYAAKLSNGDPLPAFISFSLAGLIFDLNPQTSDSGIYNIKLSFSDNTGKDSSLNILLNVSSQFLMPFNNSLLAYFSFDSTSTESSGKAYTINPIAPLYNTDRHGRTHRAISYSAAANRTETTITHPAGNEFSLSFFVKPDNNLNSASGRTILSEHKNLYLLDYITGNLRLFIRNSSNLDIQYSIGVTLSSGNWHHITFTVNALTGNAYIYINNIKYKVQAAKNILGTSNARLTIGSADAGVQEFAGLIDEWRIYTRELKPNEIALLYSNTPPSSISFVVDSIVENAPINSFVGKFTSTDANTKDTLVYSLAAAGTDNNLFVISNDSLLVNGSINFESKASLSLRVRLNDGTGEFIEKTIQLFVKNINEPPVYTGNIVEGKMFEGKSLSIKFDSIHFIDPENKFVNNYASKLITDADLPTWLQFNPNGLTFTANPTIGDAGLYKVKINFQDADNITGEYVFNLFVLTTKSNYTDSGLVAAYKFNNNLNPESGSIIGTTNGAISAADRYSKAKSSYEYNGTTNVSNFTNNAAFGFKSKFTLSTWFYQTGAGSSTGVPIGSGILIGREGEYLLATAANGEIIYAVNLPNPGWKWMYTGLIAPLNKWNHVAMTFDAGKITIYLNGDAIYSYSGTNQALGDNYPAMNNLLVGGREFFPNQQNFKGSIDDIYLFNRALSKAEAYALYNPIYNNFTFKDTAIDKTQMPVSLGKVSTTYSSMNEYPLNYSVISSNTAYTAKIENDSIVIEGTAVGITDIQLNITNGFDKASHSFKLIVTGTTNEDNFTQKIIGLYPNPVNDVLHIIGVKTGSSIALYQINGAKIIESMVTSQNYSISLSSLPAGLYIIKSNDPDLKPTLIVKE